jgi:electron transfer flavoprotein beta subunit
MRIVVCLKPVPDPKYWNRLELDPKTKTLVREGIPNIINPLDRKALEAALRLRDEKGGDVVTLSMAPPYTLSVLREALAMGADQSILLSDKLFAGSDALATSYILAAGIKKMSEAKFIICGNQTLDGGTSLVSAQIAEFLDIPNLMYVNAIKTLQNDIYHVRCQIEHGFIWVEIKLPMILSVVKEINEPRYITFMNILEGEKKEIQIWSSKDLSLSEPWIGLKGSPSQMANLSIPMTKRKGEIWKGEPIEMAKKFADRLHRWGFC